MRPALAIAAGLAGCVLFYAGGAAAETLRFEASLAGEIDASSKTPGRGTAVLSLDTESKLLTWKVEYSGLTSPRALGCGMLDRPSPDILMTNDLASPISGSKSLTEAQIAALKGGNWSCVIDTEGEEDAVGGVLKPAR